VPKRGEAAKSDRFCRKGEICKKGMPLFAKSVASRSRGPLSLQGPLLAPGVGFPEIGDILGRALGALGLFEGFANHTPS
jgi:hypothetical protein